jgi:phosphoribosylformylglycinamidine synthase PurS subunit
MDPCARLRVRLKTKSPPSYPRIIRNIIIMPHVRVIVTLKPTLLDAQGRVVQNALHSLGYATVNQVRIGKYMEMEISESGAADGTTIDATVKEMCDKLLVNPVIENYRYEVAE